MAKQPGIPAPRPQKTPLAPDNDEKKWFPNSVRKTFRSIRRFWPGDFEGGSGGRNIENFYDIIEPTLKSVRRKYAHNHSLKKPVAKITNIETGQSSLSYYLLRVYSEYVRVPTGVLSIFTHVLGDSKKGFTKTDLVNFLDSCIAAIQAMREVIVAAPEPKDVLFVELSQDKADYEARLAPLIAASSAYKRHRTKPETQEDDLIG